MPHVAVTAFGADRPGIVAPATKVFVERGCNLEDTSMTILRGHFAMMLIVDTPAGLTPGELERALAGPAAELDLVVAVRALDDEVPVSPPADAWTSPRRLAVARSARLARGRVPPQGLPLTGRPTLR